MSISFELQAELRGDQGKGASRRLRREGKVPAIMYGGGQPPQTMALNHNQLRRNLEHEAFYSHILTVKVGSEEQKAVLRDLQRHPSHPTILHVDLLRVSETEKLRLHVPLHFIGEAVAPGVKEAGGMVSHEANDVEVECLPKHLPEFIEVDISHLNIGESVHLSEIKTPEGVTLVQLARGHDLPVVSVHVRRVEIEEEVAAPVASETPEAAAGEAKGEGKGKAEEPKA